MKLTIGIDPGKSGGYAIAWGGLDSINLHTLNEDFEFIQHIEELLKHPDVTKIEAVVELVPPFAGKLIPSSTSFKLGKSAGFLEGVLRMAKIPFTLVRPQEWQKGLGGLGGLTSNKRKKVLMNHAKQFFPSTKGLTLKTADAILILRHHLNNQGKNNTMAIPQINQELEPSDYIYDPSRGLYVALRTIDPAMAEQILDTRKKNRAISRSTVNLYTKFMREGHWVLNGQPIIFADNLLIDGQHRLSACVKTGIPLEVLVVELGDSSAFKTLDQGKRRNGSDVLGIAGYTNTSVIYTALGILEKIKRVGTLGYNQLGEGARVIISNHEVEDVANKYPGLDSSATLAKTFYKSLKVKPGPIASLHYILRQTESEVVSFDEDKKSDEFMRILSTGLGLDKGNPILYFRNSLIKQMSDQIKIPPHFIIRGGILTWNNWIKGKKITRFVLGSDPKIPTAVRPI